MRACTLVTVAVLAVTPCQAARVQPELLVRSGDAASLRLDSIAEPVATASGVVFRGGTSALVGIREGIPRVLARTGDLLPGSLAGTWNDFDGVDVNRSGAIAVAGGLNDAQASHGLFLLHDGTATPIAFDAVGPYALNDRFEVAYHRRNDAIVLWSLAGSAGVPVARTGDPAPDGQTFVNFHGPLLLTESGTVVFRATQAHHVEGLFVRTPQGVVKVADDRTVFAGHRLRFDRRGKDNVVLNRAGQIAFIAGTSSSQRAVYLYDVDGTLRAVAGRHDRVGEAAISRIERGLLTLGDDGAVVFLARFRARRVAVRAANGQLELATSSAPEGPSPPSTDGGAVGPGFVTTHADVADSATAAFVARQDGLYAWEASRVTRLVANGDSLPDGRHVVQIGAYVAVGDTIAFTASDDTGREIVAMRLADGSLRTLAASGDETVASGRLAFLGSTLAVDGDRLFFVAVTDTLPAGGIFAVDVRTGVIATVVDLAMAAPGRPAFMDGLVPLASAPHGVAFPASPVEGPVGVFVARNTVRRILSVGDRLGGARVKTVGGLAGSDDLLLLVAATGRRSLTSLLSWNGGTLRRIVKEGARAPGGGRFGVPTAYDGRTASDGPTVAFVANVVRRRETTSGAFLARDRRVRRLLADGQHVEDVGDVALSGDIAIAGGRVVLGVTSRAGPRAALLALTP